MRTLNKENISTNETKFSLERINPPTLDTLLSRTLNF